MFLGTYKTYLSGKNERGTTSYRIILPKKFRKELGSEDKIYIFLGIQGEIWGFNIEQWRKEAENRLKIPLSEEKGREERREFFPRTEECVLDSQGRFILPKEFVAQAKLKEVLLVGAGDHFEIWNPKKWQQVIANAKI